MDAHYTQELVRFTHRTRFANLPAKTVHATKRVLLDTIGCAIGGHATMASRMLLDTTRLLHPGEQATIFGSMQRTTVTGAAFMNSELANLLDADETLLMLAHHANSIVASSVAVAEHVEADGKDLVTAIAVGYDVASRIGMSLEVRQEPGTGTEFGPASGMAWMIFGCASAAGHLLRLSESELMNAYGIAAMCAPIPYLGRWERMPPSNRPMTKYEFYGPLTANGVLAPFLAREGFNGDKDCLDGDLGFWRLYGARTTHWDRLVRDLGAKWWIDDTSFKAVPGCRHVSPVVDLLRNVVRANGLRPEEIETITVRGNPVMAERGFDRFPENEVDVLFSVPYLLAVALVDNFSGGPDWVRPERLHDPRVRSLASKVILERNSRTSASIKAQMEATGFYKQVPTQIVVSARGMRFHDEADFAKGDPWSKDSRMSDDELAAKFIEMSRERLDPPVLEKAIDQIMNIDKVDNVRELTTMLVS